MITINKLRCPQNHACPAINVCPVRAINQLGDALPTIDIEKCVECGSCIGFCPMGAIENQ